MLEAFLTKKPCHRNAFQRLSDIFYQEAFAQINNENSKLRTYSLVKTKIGIETYLREPSILNTQDRIILSKFRLSNHELMIEKGRHTKIDKSKRYCPSCLTSIETEIHFLLHCGILANLRKKLFEDICPYIYTNFHDSTDEEKFAYLLNKQEITKDISRFLRKSFQLRSYLQNKYKIND